MLIFQPCLLTPVVIKKPSGDSNNSRRIVIPQAESDVLDLCPLPEKLGYSGKITLVEDCFTLDQYENIPSIGIYLLRGSNVFICCPNAFSDSVTFEAEPPDYSDYAYY